MNKRNENRERMADLLDELATEEGIQRTPIEGVVLARHAESRPRTPAVYEPVIVFIGQGQKRAYLNDEVFTYDPLQYLVLSAPLPVECEWDASPQEPLLLVALSVDPAMLGEIVLEMDDHPPSLSGTMPRAISTTPMSEELSDVVVRLLECLKRPMDGRILGRQTVREILYRVLLGEQGGSLGALAYRHEHFTRIARVLKRIHTEYAAPLGVEEMAKRSHMSVASFHQNFKLVTGSSPLQYLKRVRLDQARRLMLHDGYNASTAARAVGYESPSQFSREFKRLFGVTPIEDMEQSRGRLVDG